MTISELTGSQLGLLQELHRFDGRRPSWRQFATAIKLERAGYITPRPNRPFNVGRWNLTEKGHEALAAARIHRRRPG